MDDDMQADGVLRVARRIYVGNLNWKTTWQDLKVSNRFCRPASIMRLLHPSYPGPVSHAAPCTTFRITSRKSGS